jgi:hypothetical protein
MRRPPDEYVSLLTQDEQQFRSYVDSLEHDPQFQKLLTDGVITKMRLRGKVPRERYEEFMDVQLMAFLDSSGITQHEGWEADLLSPHAPDRLVELAAKYRVPAGDLLRYLRYMRWSDYATRGRGSTLGTLSAPRRDAQNNPPAEVERSGTTAMVDLTEIIETTREFVERYSVSEQDFLDLILGGEATPPILAERFGCSLREAEEVLEAADRIYLVEHYTPSQNDAGRKPASRSLAMTGDEPVAVVEIVDGQPSIQFEHESVYTQRYRISPEATAPSGDSDGTHAGRDLLMRARFINQRLSALSRLIAALCTYQTEYLASGNMPDLKPLMQSDVARQLGEHASTICRLIRGKSIKTPWGNIPLMFLCQSKTDVVARLIGQYPKLTDQQVVIRLREDYDCIIARRTVAYHRGKRMRRNKPRSTSAGSTQETATT